MSNSLNNSRKKTAGVITADIFTDMISRVVGIYVILMLAVFPVFITDMYYNVLNDKYYFFFYSTLVTTMITLMILLIGLLGGALRKQKDGTSPLKEIFRLTLADKFLLAFIAVITVSTIASEWPYEAFWGNVGRLQGMFFFLTVLVAWFLVTKFLKYKTWYMYLFLAVGVIVCLWGATDYLGMDLFGWRADANDYWNMINFSSTIGNVNTLTAITALYFGASAVMCLGKKHLWFFLPVFFAASLAMITGTSDNAVLAVGGVFGLLPFYLAGDRDRIPGYVLLLALFALAMAVVGAVTASWTRTTVLIYYNWGILLNLANNTYKTFFAVAAVLALTAVLLWVLLRKVKLPPVSEGAAKTARIVWGCICILVILFAAYCVYDANTAGNLKFLENYRQYLVFNDRWGTNRGYAWRSSLEFFKEFGLFKKLFGSGPETYAIFMAKNYYYEMMEFMDSVFDSPHSEPLQYLFTTGILGFVCHYALMVTGFVKGLCSGGHAAAYAFAVASYICASLINISVPISTPLLFLVLALALTVKKNEEQAPNA